MHSGYHDKLLCYKSQIKMFIETEPKRAYRNNLLHVRKLFSAYFHKLSIITIGKKKSL
jgi:hypothetical protein